MKDCRMFRRMREEIEHINKEYKKVRNIKLTRKKVTLENRLNLE